MSNGLQSFIEFEMGSSNIWVAWNALCCTDALILPKNKVEYTFLDYLTALAKQTVIMQLLTNAP